METFHEDRTIRTPLITGDPSSGIIEMSGRSYPENAVEFYRPFREWLQGIVVSPPPSIEFTMDMEYFNTSTEGTLFEIINSLADISEGRNIRIIWRFESDDMDMRNKGNSLHAHFGELIDLQEKETN